MWIGYIPEASEGKVGSEIGGIMRSMGLNSPCYITIYIQDNE